MNRYKTLSLALTLTAGISHAASAQDAPIDLGRLQALTRPGDTLYVRDSAGRDTKLRLGDVPLEVVFERAGVSAAEVTEVAVERGDSPWNGALIGLAVAGAPWLAVCAANDWCYYNEYGAENMLRASAFVTAAIGAGLGALFDLSKRTRTTVAPATARKAAPGVDQRSSSNRLSSMR